MSLTLNANALVDLDPFKGFVKVPLAILTQDALLRDFINEASSLCESYCGRKFRSATYTEYQNGSKTPEIMFKQWPVSSITTVAIDPDRLFPISTVLDPTTYTLTGDTNGEGILVELFSQVFPAGRKIVKLVYTAGYATFASVPGDLQLACKRIAAYYFKQQQQEDFTESEKTKDKETVKLIDGIPQAAAQLLNRYMRLEMEGDVNPTRNS
jgi:hypothetical protein